MAIQMMARELSRTIRRTTHSSVVSQKVSMVALRA